MHADEMIERLSLRPHPEGGFFRETFRHQPMDGQRGALTAIYYLLRSGERSAWHRVDAIEVWHYYDGASTAVSSGHRSRTPPDISQLLGTLI